MTIKSKWNISNLQAKWYTFEKMKTTCRDWTTAWLQKGYQTSYLLIKPVSTLCQTQPLREGVIMQPLPRRGQYVPDRHQESSIQQRDRKAASPHDVNSLTTARDLLLSAKQTPDRGTETCQRKRWRPPLWDATGHGLVRLKHIYPAL